MNATELRFLRGHYATRACARNKLHIAQKIETIRAMQIQGVSSTSSRVESTSTPYYEFSL